MKIKRKTFVGGLLATLCACATVLTGLSFAGGNTVAAADTPVKQSAAYLNLDGGTNILNGFEGAQKENVYFGANNGSPVKWRVLSKNGSNYGSGMLLWADSQITQEAYNTYTYNLDYAFWGTSKIRARLNGGIYYNAVSNQTDAPSATTTVIETDSWYGKLFTLTEQKAVEATGSYVTDLWGCDVNQPTYLCSKVGITVTSTENDNSSTVCGKYNINRINSSHPTSQYAIVNGTSVYERTSGDKLFLLSYYDINNTDYGFGDSGQTYENKVTAYAYSGTPQSDVFPCYFDGSGHVFNGITSNYLKDTGGVSCYWLRDPGRQNNAKSDALLVTSSGWIGSHYCNIDGAAGIRPAFNLDTTKIIYANSKSVSVGSTFTDVASNSSVTTPEYKLYVKSADYNTYSSKAISTMRVEGGNLKVIYNNPAEIESGNIVVLLTEKGSTDGAVAYQATATISSTASASKSAVASFSLSGIDYSQYDTTVLLTSANGGNYAETVYCSYNMEGNVTVPSDVENLTYDGTCKWVGSLSTKPDWYDENLHINDNVMTVSAISYKSMATDATFTPLTAPESGKLTDLIVDAGEYEITMTLDNGLKWAGSNTTGGDQKFKIKIGQKPSSVTPVYAAAPTYIPDKLPDISLSADSTKGTIAWDDEQKIEVGNKSYTWTFKPTDTNNYTVVEGSKSFNFEARVVDTVTIKSFNTNGATVYTNTLDTVLKTYLTVEIKYVSFDETITLDPGDYELQINSNNKLKAGANKLKVKYGTVWSDDFPISGVVELSYKTITNIALSDDTFTYPVTASEILSKITAVDVKMNDNSSDSLKADQIASLMEVDGDLTAGTKDVTFKIKDSDAETDYEITINQGTLTPTVTFDDLTVTYDGNAKSITATVSGLPEGVTLTLTYTVTGDATTYNAAGYTNAGTYNYSVTFTHTDKNYAQYTGTKTATLQIDKASYDDEMPTGYDTKKQVTYTGSAIPLPANWITGLPSGVTVTYYEADGTTLFADKTNVDEYTVKAVFTVADPANYEVPETVTLTFEITDKLIYTPSVTFENATFTYDGQPHSIALDGEVPAWIIVKYYKADGMTPFTGATNVADSGTVIAKFTHSDPEYADIPDMTATITIEKATVDMDGVEFADKTVTGNGQAHKVEATNLPKGVTVEYEYNGKKQATPFEFTEVGDYTVKAYFTYEDEDNYEAIEYIEATLTVSDAVVESISANVENGAKFDINGTLDDVKAKIKAEIHFNNGTKEQAEVEDLTITCATLREGGLLEVGTQTITVTYNDGTQDFTTTVQIEVAKAKVALPVYNGSLKYTGDVLKPVATDFEGFDSALMALVESKTVAGLNAGAYKAVFALKDSDRYQWATATTLKKTVFAAVVYEQVVLEDYEAAVDWNLAKAKITATKANGKLPVFASESYTGSFAEVVGLKYYTDETCAEEVAADELGYSTKYFVKAELIDAANFELDETAMAFSKTAFEYTTPEKQLTVWEKIVKFLTINWLWIVIAVVSLILIILLIALAARAAKRKRIREEQRLEREERKEEERRLREEERRREDREERMAARMAQPQMMMPQMPQMMQMPQQPPQYAPQQPMAAGGGSASELAEIKAEISALRAEQNLRDVSALKAEQQVTQTKIDLQFANLFARLGGEQSVQGGPSMNWLEEMVDKAVQKALAKNGNAEAQGAKAESATTQVPPDAVMTTVTTTKIDTTKKPAQSAAAPAPVRTVVRNIVAPMPVDDGRVFDVGGFYKPADPVTDNIDDVLGNEDKLD